MHSSWLRKQTTVEEAEAAHLIMLPSDSGVEQAVPFGHCHSEWMELLGKKQPGDEIWEFSSGDSSWQNLAGRAGVALVRGGEVIASVLTRMS